jgi:hypothetical protein
LVPLHRKKDELPLDLEVAKLVASNHLNDVLFQSQSNIYLSSLQVHILFYHGMELPEGNICSPDSVELMTILRTGYLV